MTQYAVSWSGGKDSTLALDRARRQGVDVSHLFNIYEGSSGLVRFHGVHHHLIAQQAESLGLRIVQRHTHPEGFETVFHAILAELVGEGVGGIIFGNIHLADIRAWFEERTASHRLQHLEPLWEDDPESLVAEFIDRGYLSRIVGLDLSRANPKWLGRTFDRSFLDEVRVRADVDLCGERGEYHTFVSDGPLFQWNVPYSIRGEGEIDGHRYLDLQPGDGA